MRPYLLRTTMTRSTLSRRARNSASVTTGRRRPASRPSRRRCFFASRRVEPLTRCGSVMSFGSGCWRGWRTRTTVFGASSPSRGASPERRRVRVRRLVCAAESSSATGAAPPRCCGVRVGAAARVISSGEGVGRSGAWNSRGAIELLAARRGAGAGTVSVAFSVAVSTGAADAADSCGAPTGFLLPPRRAGGVEASAAGAGVSAAAASGTTCTSEPAFTCDDALFAPSRPITPRRLRGAFFGGSAALSPLAEFWSELVSSTIAGALLVRKMAAPFRVLSCVRRVRRKQILWFAHCPCHGHCATRRLRFAILRLGTGCPTRAAHGPYLMTLRTRALAARFAHGERARSSCIGCVASAARVDF